MSGVQGTKERLIWVDVLKCLGIWAVYIGHFGEGAGRWYEFAYLFQNALFLCVPVFFILIVITHSYLM